MTLHQIYNAEETLREWLGEGGQPDPQAQDRADVCSGRLNGKPCPYNYRGGWIMPKAIADTVRAWLEAKNGLALKVEGEDRLGHCECCNCVLSLKIHVPRKHIMNHTSPKEYAKFPYFCWLKTENQ